MKSTITITVDTDILRIFRVENQNVSGAVSKLMAASINYKEPKDGDIKDKITAAKANIAEWESQEAEEQKEKNKMTWEDGN